MTRALAFLPAAIGTGLFGLALDTLALGHDGLGAALLGFAALEALTACLVWRAAGQARRRQVQQRRPEAQAGGREGGRAHVAIIGRAPATVTFRPDEAIP